MPAKCQSRELTGLDEDLHDCLDRNAFIQLAATPWEMDQRIDKPSSVISRN